MTNDLLAFIGVAIAVVVVPGPDMALVARNVFRYDRAAGFATSFGICTGILGWAVAAALGIATILATSSVAFTVLKLAGAAYLVYLGISTLRSPHAFAPSDVRDRRQIPGRQAYAQGLVSSLLNPKLGVFFLTLLPQFIVPGEASAVTALQLAIVFNVIGITWLLTYSALLAALGDALGRGTPQRVIRWVSGTVLVALGVRVALERT